MTHGEKCPVCGSKNVSDDSIYYTYDKPSKTEADWICNNCSSDYSVIYKAEKIRIQKFISDDEYEDEYEIII